MIKQMTFIDWLENIYKTSGGKLLSERSLGKYNSSIDIISKEMIDEKVIIKKLTDMNLYDLDIAISLIFSNDNFIVKDTTGKKMYSNALKKYRCYKYHMTEFGTQEYEQVVELEKSNKTEKESLLKSRVGQGVFRKRVMDNCNKKCVITGITLQQTLIASHIKPWSISTDSERLDKCNGLLLSATFDRLFDSGLITISTDGKIKVSNLIDSNNIDLLGLNKYNKCNLDMDTNMQVYIKYHNENIFVK